MSKGSPRMGRPGPCSRPEDARTYGVKYLRYWFDEDAGKVFCLVEAPDKEAAMAVHREAHGLVADELIEVVEDHQVRTRRGSHPASSYRCIWHCARRKQRVRRLRVGSWGPLNVRPQPPVC